MISRLSIRCVALWLPVGLWAAPCLSQEVLVVKAGVWTDPPSHAPAWAEERQHGPSHFLWDGGNRAIDASSASRLRPDYNWIPALQPPLLPAEAAIGDLSLPENQLLLRFDRSLAGTPDGEMTLYSADAVDIYTSDYGKQFFNGWALITSVEVGLLAVTMAAPKEWTGWNDSFVQDGMRNLRRAWTEAPRMDGDHWFHNYVGHPYGGSVYYNTVRCQGAGWFGSFFFSAFMSAQWEYAFEAVAEQPSIQDLIITPTTGAILGEAVHVVTNRMKRNGTSFFEKVAILFLNPTSVVLVGFN